MRLARKLSLPTGGSNMLNARAVMMSAALFLGVGAAPASPNTLSQECKVGSVAVTSSDVYSSTSSTAFLEVPDGAVTFNQRRSGCVVVDFAAVARAGNNGSGQALEIEAWLDGVPMFPGRIQLAGNDNGFAQSHAATWHGSVTAGSHTVQMRYRTSFSGKLVELFNRSTKVAHK